MSRTVMITGSRRIARAHGAGLAMACGVSALLLATSAMLGAQQPKPQRPAPPTTQAPRRQETIEIRGQVPTPQVVTVRPRETPAYSRRVLVPMYFDHDFWPSILPPLQIVSPTGGAAAPSDSASRSPADSARRARPATPRPPPGTPPAPLRR